MSQIMATVPMQNMVSFSSVLAATSTGRFNLGVTVFGLWKHSF